MWCCYLLVLVNIVVTMIRGKIWFYYVAVAVAAAVPVVARSSSSLLLLLLPGHGRTFDCSRSPCWTYGLLREGSLRGESLIRLCRKLGFILDSVVSEDPVGPCVQPETVLFCSEEVQSWTKIFSCTGSKAQGLGSCGGCGELH